MEDNDTRCGYCDTEYTEELITEEDFSLGILGDATLEMFMGFWHFERQGNITDDTPKLVASFHSIQGDYSASIMKSIYYCPFCGRKLV